eukprot:g5679.t1
MCSYSGDFFGSSYTRDLKKFSPCLVPRNKRKTVFATLAIAFASAAAAQREHPGTKIGSASVESSASTSYLHWYGVQPRGTCRRLYDFFDRTTLVWEDWFRRECSRARSVFAFDRYLKRLYLRDGARRKAIGPVPGGKENDETAPPAARAMFDKDLFRVEYQMPRRRLAKGDRAALSGSKNLHPQNSVDLEKYQCKAWDPRPEQHVNVSVEAPIWAVINPVRSEVTFEVKSSSVTGIMRQIPVFEIVPKSEQPGGSQLPEQPREADGSAEASSAYDVRAGRYKPLLSRFDRSSKTGNYTIFLPQDTYEDRFNGSSFQQTMGLSRGCDSHLGLWSNDTRPDVKCYLDNLGEMLHFDESTSVLDWGSGCGHQLAYLAGTFGVSGLGIEPVAGAVASAIESFTHVLSYGALYHFENTAQCDVLHQMLRIAREKVVIGWHVDAPTTYGAATCPRWERCLENLRLKTRGLFYGVVEVCLPERCIFGASTYGLPFDSIIVQKVYG